MAESNLNSANVETDGLKGSFTRPKLASVMFVVILIGLGIPVWWRTTTVHRAALPYQQIADLRPMPEYEMLRVLFKHSDDKIDKSVINKIEEVMKNSGKFAVQLFDEMFSQNEHRQITDSLSISELDLKIGKCTENEEHNLVLFELPERLFPPSKDVIIGKCKTVYLKKGIDHMGNLDALQRFMFPAAYIGDNIHQDNRKMPPSTEYNILLTLATPDFNFNFDMQGLVSDFIQPFLSSVKEIADIRIKTQVINVGTHYVSGTWDDKEKHYRITEDETVTLINALEPKLGSQLSVVPTFQWVFFVPQERQSPMQIYIDQKKEISNTVLSPRWGNGGIQILNGNSSFSNKALAETVITQLRLALGFPSTYPSENFGFLQYETSLTHQWEIELVKRLRTIEFQHNTVKTLQSLCNLLSQIGNIVISDSIGDDIVGAMKDSAAAKEALKSGDLDKALSFSRRAFAGADRAFFHPSLLALLYFPDDQKYAIYIPLFLPVGIPIVLSMRPLLRWIFKKKEKIE